MIPLYDSVRSGRFPVFTVLLIAVNIWVFYLEITSAQTERLFLQYALIPATVESSNIATYTPFVTSLFLHGGLLHLATNMLFLWVFGDNVEERLGWIFPIYYILGGVAGGLMQYFSNPSSFIPIVGASGAIAAVLGGYLVFFPRHSIQTLVPVFGLPAIIPIPAVLMLGYWFLIQLFNGISQIATTVETSGVAWFAHIGGFVFGWVVAHLLRTPDDTNERV